MLDGFPLRGRIQIKKQSLSYFFSVLESNIFLELRVSPVFK